MEGGCKPVMRTVLTVFIFTFGKCYGQCDTTKLDTLKKTYVLIDTARYWTYYNPNGSEAWMNVPNYNASLIPKNGYAVAGDFLPEKKINGYVVYRMDRNCNITQVDWLDSKKKPLVRNGKFVDYRTGF